MQSLGYGVRMDEPELMAFCVEVLGSADGAIEWMIRRSPLFSGKRPVELTGTPEGRAEIERVLRSARAGFPV
jgi:uncharacterized protein (DUF2384 family)